MDIIFGFTTLVFFSTTICYAAKLIKALDENQELRQKIKQLQK